MLSPPRRPSSAPSLRLPALSPPRLPRTPHHTQRPQSALPPHKARTLSPLSSALYSPSPPHQPRQEHKERSPTQRHVQPSQPAYTLNTHMDNEEEVEEEEEGEEEGIAAALQLTALMLCERPPSPFTATTY